jgi:hypothetical protein
MDRTLDEIGLQFGTDQSSKGHDYLHLFEEVFAPWRDREFDLLEIGLARGASIRTWHSWFTRARIVGADVRQVDLEDAAEMPRYIFRQGSQTDPVFLDTLLQEFDFRIVIDDASHLWGHQIFGFETIFPRLRPGGLYICEDLHTSSGGLAERYHGGAPESAADYFMRIARAVAGGKAAWPARDADPRLHHIVSTIRTITVFKHCVIVRK